MQTREEGCDAAASLLALLVFVGVAGLVASAASQALPNGKACYAFQVSGYTTTDLTPAQIHVSW